MHYIGHRASDTNPLRSIPLLRPAHAVIGWTPLEQARAQLDRAERIVPIVRANLRSAHAELGHANRRRTLILRRALQASAMRCINDARRALLDTHRKLDAARAEVERLENEPELPFEQPAPAPTGRRILREDVGTFPASTVITVERSPNAGFYARIVRPGTAGGIASHHDSDTAARAWVECTLAAPVVH